MASFLFGGRGFVKAPSPHLIAYWVSRQTEVIPRWVQCPVGDRVFYCFSGTGRCE